MRFIEIEPAARGGRLVRQVRLARRGQGVVMAVVVGDEQGAHAVRWMRPEDGAVLHSRELPAGCGGVEPALSPDLTLLAYVERGAEEWQDHAFLEAPERPAPNARMLAEQDRYNA